MCVDFEPQIYCPGLSCMEGPTHQPPEVPNSHTSVTLPISWGPLHCDCTAGFLCWSTKCKFYSLIMSKFLLKGEGGEKAELRRRIEACFVYILVFWGSRYLISRWGNISTKLTRMGTGVWPRRNGTRSSTSQGSRHRCEKYPRGTRRREKLFLALKRFAFSFVLNLVFSSC